MYRIYVKKVYINPQGIASDRNPLVTCADSDHISPISEDIMTKSIMQCIEYITFDGYSKSQNRGRQASKKSSER